jgi:hypothetical protein
LAIKHQQNQEDIHSFQILKTAREYAGQKQETIPINGHRLKKIKQIKTLNNKKMRNLLQHSPTESRRFTYFSKFKDSKRVRWTESRNYVR